MACVYMKKCMRRIWQNVAKSSDSLQEQQQKQLK